MSDAAATFDAREFPDRDAARRLARLVGIDDQQNRLSKSLQLILDPSMLDHWAKKNGEVGRSLADYYRGRQPVFVLAGDVGTGKTELAETIGDRVARECDIPVTLYRMSLSSRGSGLVGEMTRLIADVFAQVMAAAQARAGTVGRARGGTILFIDEADALAQSREATQMHHEDRAGVNALIRGIDDLTQARLPVAVVLATNRVSQLDPAVRRRAADVLIFERPGDEQRKMIFSSSLGGTISEAEIHELVGLTGPSAKSVGFTYSDITQRLLPSLVLAAIPDRRISFALVKEALAKTKATPSFIDGGGP